MRFYNKYANLGVFDFTIYLVIICLCLAFSIGSILLELPKWMIIYPIVLIFLYAIDLLVKLTEKFSIVNNTIIVKKLFKEIYIDVPDKYLIIVTNADICPFLSKRNIWGYGTIQLKKRYMASIIKNSSIDEVKGILHKNSKYNPTASEIKDLFKEYDFCYSFVINNEMFKHLMSNKNVFILCPNKIKAEHELLNTLNSYNGKIHYFG